MKIAIEVERVMKIQTKHFGEIQISEDSYIRFPKGMIGFEQYKRFILLENEEYEPFRWLISVDNREVGFPVINPFLIKPNYEKELPEPISNKLSSAKKSLDVLCVVTLKGENGKITINLKSPVIIDYSKRVGEQIILASDELPVTQPLSGT